MIRRLLLALCLLVAAALPASAAEEILSFDSDITVQKDGDLIVTETIRVRAEGRRIKRGIYRDFPVRYTTENGFEKRVGFKVEEVLRDGQPEPHHSETVGAYKRTYIGKESVFLTPGRDYTYTLRYRTSRQLLFNPDFDEIYWNVTGNRWEFPIRHASATIHLPEGARILESRGYTGREGEAGDAYRVTASDDTRITFESTRTLHPGEGLTVAVYFPKGIVAEPGEVEQALSFLRANAGFGVFLIAFAAIARYLWSAWNRVGRDPESGPIIPLFEPPAGFSPAAVSYLYYMGLKSRSGATLAFIAALISLAVKGVIRIDASDKKKVAVERVEKSPGQLPSGERAIFDTLLAYRDSFVFHRSNAKTVVAVMSAFRGALLGEYRGVFFKDNILPIVIAIFVSVLALVALIGIWQPTDDDDIGRLVFSVIAGIAGTITLMIALTMLWRRLPIEGTPVGAVVLFILTGLIYGVFAIILLTTPQIVPAVMVAGVFLLAAMNIVFVFLIGAPTAAGRKLMDEIAGFRLYLLTAETDRLNMIGAPEMSTDLFEKYLPYAIGLEAEEPWSDALSKHIARAMPASSSGSSYHPRWYSGSSAFSASSLSSATSGLVSSIGSSVASSVPKSSSSSGGGSSGGGGGGGGGGGW